MYLATEVEIYDFTFTDNLQNSWNMNFEGFLKSKKARDKVMICIMYGNIMRRCVCKCATTMSRMCSE